ncbi:hypothetical protein HA402_007794 [Bradysia odoriphaga]|nr:hypothetical protein HA402_007794 [Bradysia odoriphaga]
MKTFTRMLMQDRRIQEQPILPETSEQPIKHEAIKCRYNIDDFNSIIESIKRVLEFLQLFVAEMTLDAAVGTRALQGQLQLILESFTIPVEIRTEMEQILKNVTDVSDNIVGHFVDSMMKNDQSPEGKERLKQNLYWIESGTLWEMPAAGDWQDADALDLKRYEVVDDSSITFNESNFSDGCIGTVFANCTVPAECFTSFLGKRYSEYLIAHAILFLLFAKKKNCFDDEQYMEKISKVGDPNDIMASFCAKMFVEAQTIDMTGFNIMRRDLFCEQVLVCSMSGFRQFLHPSWLRTILSWQSKGSLGCFEVPKHHASKTFEEIYGIKKDGKRVKRYDNVISAGTQSCSTHFTGVAIGSIGMHLRYLMETCPETLFDST